MNLGQVICTDYPHRCRPGAEHFPIYRPTGNEQWLSIRQHAAPLKHPAPAPTSYRKNRDAIIDILRKAPRSGYCLREILARTHIASSTLTTSLRDMVTTGELLRTGEPREFRFRLAKKSPA